MEPIEISDDEVLELLERVVNERGSEHVYRADDRPCAYFSADGTPDCIVGHVFALKGITRHDVAELNAGNGVGAFNTNSTSWTWRDRKKPLITISERAEDALCAAQNAQDTGKPWGRALTVAREVLASEPDPS